VLIFRPSARSIRLQARVSGKIYDAVKKFVSNAAQKFYKISFKPLKSKVGLGLAATTAAVEGKKIR